MSWLRHDAESLMSRMMACEGRCQFGRMQTKHPCAKTAKADEAKHGVVRSVDGQAQRYCNISKDGNKSRT